MKRDHQGFTLIEVVLGLFMMAVGVIATAPLFVYAAQQNAGGGDAGVVGALAVRQMEQLRGTEYWNMVDGGSLTSDVNGYFDRSTPGYVVRWTIVDNPNPPAPTKVLVVHAITEEGTRMGAAKRVTLVAIRGK